MTPQSIGWNPLAASATMQLSAIAGLLSRMSRPTKTGPLDCKPLEARRQANASV